MLHQQITLEGESLTHNVIGYVRMAAICSVYEIGLTSLVTSPTSQYRMGAEEKWGL